MTKVYPNAASPLPPAEPAAVTENFSGGKGDDRNPTVLTVWKKSLLFNCDGFTVYDARGNLVYRVDNYISGNRAGEVVLMDASGNSLLTIRRRKKLRLLGDSWSVYDGETAVNPRFSVEKNVNLVGGGSSKTVLAHVAEKNNASVYGIEGSYSQRRCAVYDGKRRQVAEIKQKEAPFKGVAFGTDIFNLVVQPGFDAAVAMAVVILVDQMYGSSSPRRRRRLSL
ncbi:hypothetical protein ABFS83_06G181600 [Erythranthe nasuta]